MKIEERIKRLEKALERWSEEIQNIKSEIAQIVQVLELPQNTSRFACPKCNTELTKVSWLGAKEPHFYCSLCDLSYVWVDGKLVRASLEG